MGYVRTENAKLTRERPLRGYRYLSLGDCLHRFLQGSKPIKEGLSPLCGRDQFSHGQAGVQIVAQFVKGRTNQPDPRRAQLIPKPPQDDQQDYIGGIFQKSEWRPCALIETTLASRTTEQAITRGRFLVLLSFVGEGFYLVLRSSESAHLRSNCSGYPPRIRCDSPRQQSSERCSQ